LQDLPASCLTKGNVMKKIIAVVTVASLLVACQNTGMGGGMGGISKQDAGTVLGGVGGALLGSQIGGGKGQLIGVAAGTLLGSALGSSVGASLDRADVSYYNRASQEALENGSAGKSLPWKNPETGHSGSVTPSKYYQTSDGQYCREYTQSIKVGGRVQEGVGVACRSEDGTWRIKE
jgi:surface antigen